MILFLRFRSDSEQALKALAKSVESLRKHVPGFTIVQPFEPLYQNEDSEDLPILDGFDCPEWKSVREDIR